MPEEKYKIAKAEFKKKMLAELFKTKKALVNYENAIFDYTFDRAYSLGKQKEAITQEDVEKASLKYILNRQQARHDAKREEEASLSDFDNTLKAWDAFDMAQAYEDGANFALGKKFGNPEQVDVEKAAERYADEIRIPASIPGVMVSFINGLAHDAYLQGAQDFLGKQEKDADTVISGWVARDMDGELYIYEDKPKRGTMEWLGRLSPEFDLQMVKWSDEPLEVEIIIKRKKKTENQ